MSWQAYLTVAAVACLPMGLIWDISWHISIGRDTFWAPAHIVIQLGGVIPALLFGWQALRITFHGTAEERGRSVHFWGARASFGAWVTIWGAVAMLTSAPFDDWWHNTYGLDVKITSPPHAVLGLGMFAVALGVFLFVLSWQNRAVGTEQQKAALLFALAAGLLVTMFSVYATEYTWPNRQHSANFYKVIACLYPFLLVMAAKASKLRWAATLAAATYTAIMLVMIWGLPLFPAQPKLAPIYNPVDHMVPPPFPMLLLLPALATDFLMRQSVSRKWLGGWLQAAAVGLTFLLLTLGVQWFFSLFLLSPAADNWFFAGGRHWPYYSQPGDWMHRFWDLQQDPVTLKSVAVAVALAVLSARFGLWCGTWMLRVKR